MRIMIPVLLRQADRVKTNTNNKEHNKVYDEP